MGPSSADNEEEDGMELPRIDLGSLPELEASTGLFGSLSAGGMDDTIVAIMVYVFDHAMVEMLL